MPRLTFAFVEQFARQHGIVVERQSPNSYTGRYAVWSNEKMPGVTADCDDLEEAYAIVWDAAKAA